MRPLHNIAATVVSDIIRRQPASTERTAFAWAVAVGPALARATSVELDGDALVVHARDARWAREIVRAVDIVLLRLQQLLGRDAIRSIRVLEPRASSLDHRS